MFRSVLIANRGEIALRIIRTARRLGMRTIAVHSRADAGALHVEAADEAVLLGPSPARHSYLDAERVLEAARASGVDCLHPGYGFLAENADFAAACGQAGIVFVGPPAAAIRAMGRKDEAKALMAQAGVPVLPGDAGAAQDDATLTTEARRIGFPLLVKPVAGGGGKGMRLVRDMDGLAEALAGARREAKAAFGDEALLLERLVEPSRHVEMQIFADGQGQMVHLFERDCSLQRRHQKIVEEAPAPGMTAGLRERMAQAALAAAAAVHYVGAGTVEFLVEGRQLNDASPFYFIEMNTRLQVEHPVTEMVTGLDLVEWQFRIAAGEPLPCEQADIALAGHAVEARLYAEAPEQDFLPSAGRVLALRWPPADDVRIDAGIAIGSEISPHYDPLLAKIVVRGATRPEALARASEALASTLLAGPRTNLAFLHRLLGRKEVAGAAFDTGLVDRLPTGGGSAPSAAVRTGILALLRLRQRASEARAARRSREPWSPWSRADGFQLAPEGRRRLVVLVDGQPREADVAWTAEAPRVWLDGGDGEEPVRPPEVVEAGDAVLVVCDLRQIEIAWPGARAEATAGGGGDGVVRAPLHGRLARLFVGVGDTVRRGDRIAIVEAMKMEHVLRAEREGRVAELADEGVQVAPGSVIAVIKGAAGP